MIVEESARPAVVMKAGAATLRHLTLRVNPGGSAAYAVDVPQGALALEECKLSSGTQACLGARGAAAKPTLRKHQLQGDAHGLRVDQKARATLEECSLSRNGGTGVFVSGAGSVELTACRLAENGAQWLLCRDGGPALLVDCNVTGYKTQGVLSERGAEPELRNTRVFRNTLAGVTLDNGAVVVAVRRGSEVVAASWQKRWTPSS